MARTNDEIRSAVKAAVCAEVERVGRGAFRPALVATRFDDVGVGRATIYRWIGESLKSGEPERRLAKRIRAAGARRAQRHAEPAAAVAAMLPGVLPTVPNVDDVLGRGALPVMVELRRCLSLAHRLIAHAQSPEGAIKNSKLTLQAAEYLRRCLETAARLQEAIADREEYERLVGNILAEIREISPETAERIFARMNQVFAEAEL